MSNRLPYHAAWPVDRRIATIVVIDDDAAVRDELKVTLTKNGYSVILHPRYSELPTKHFQSATVALVDPRGVDSMETITRLGEAVPTIVMTGDATIEFAVRALQAGASDFIEKPLCSEHVLSSIQRLFERRNAGLGTVPLRTEDAVARIAKLTFRQRQILALIMTGHPNKIIAADLGISQRTVENHRASIMRKTECKSLPKLVQVAMSGSQF